MLWFVEAAMEVLSRVGDWMDSCFDGKAEGLEWKSESSYAKLDGRVLNCKGPGLCSKGGRTGRIKLNRRLCGFGDNALQDASAKGLVFAESIDSC